MRWGLVSLIFVSSLLLRAQTPPVGNSSGGGQVTGDDISQNYEISPQLDYIYDPTGKKDPFKPYRVPRIRGRNQIAQPVDPLILLDTSRLKLVAVMWNTPKPRAVVQDPEGHSYVLFKNMRIGHNDGVVVDIREGEVVIVEKFDDGFGNIIRESKVLDMGPADQAAGGQK